ncbi:MAG: ATP synthase subunit I [Anaerolineae bacterium]
MDGDIGSGIAWFVVGLAVGLVHTISVVWTVGRLQAGQRRRNRVIMWRGYALRAALIALTMVLAVRRSVWASLWLVGGLLAARWAPVYLGRSGEIDWSWFDRVLEE